MAWWTTYKIKRHCFGVRMDFIKFALKNGVDDIVIMKSKSNAKQIRFANNNIQIFKNWKSETVRIFLAYKKRIINTIVFS